MEKVDITIIGAGIIGLSISAALDNRKLASYVLEQRHTFGQETSSRNSEVIHAGIYYPAKSLKARFCVEGNRMLYEICRSNGIANKKLGKLIVAENTEEVVYLHKLKQNAEDNGVAGLSILNKNEVLAMEPNINALAALYSPETGILDSHGLMHYFFTKAKNSGVEFSFNSSVEGLKKVKDGYQLTVVDSDGSRFEFISRIVINCAGLNADKVAALAGIDTEACGYKVHFCKGQYFRVHSSKTHMITHLIYPVPDKKGISLGIHVTPDLGGGVRLGPDAHYIKKEAMNYDVDDKEKNNFAQSVQRILPFVSSEDLSADTAGIRPKLQGPGESFHDFVISEETDKGYPGLINLIGIDSPGLSAAPAIATYVQEILLGII